MVRNFEVFRGRHMVRTVQPMITIQKGGSIVLNEAAYTALGQPHSVELLYDREQAAIGVRAASPSVLHSYSVQRQKGSNSYHVTGRSFTSYYEIDVSEPHRYQAQLEEDVLVADLGQRQA